MLKEVTAGRATLPLLRQRLWVVPIMVLLGTLAALSEGVGISLIIPLFSAVGGTGQQAATNAYTRLLESLVSSLGPEARLLWIPALIFAAVLGKNVLAYLNQALFSWTSSHVLHRLRTALFTQLLTLDYGFLERAESGKPLNIRTTESWRVGQALTVLVTLLTACCTILAFVALLLLISWQTTVTATGAVLIISTAIRFATRRAGHLGEALVSRDAGLAERMLEGLSAMRVIRAFGREQHEQARFGAASEEVRAALLRLEILSSAVRPLSEVCYAGLFVALLVFALHRMASLPALLAFVVILQRLQHTCGISPLRASISSASPAP
jgi:ATP-binding cassette, subfamily B, bacterial MsbA